MSIRITGYPMDYMIRLRVIKPFAFVYPGISWFWRWQESKVADKLTIILNDKTSILLHIRQDNSLRRIAIIPLMHVTRLPHDLLCSIHDLHDFGQIRRCCHVGIAGPCFGYGKFRFGR